MADPKRKLRRSTRLPSSALWSLRSIGATLAMVQRLRLWRILGGMCHGKGVYFELEHHLCPRTGPETLGSTLRARALRSAVPGLRQSSGYNATDGHGAIPWASNRL